MERDVSKKLTNLLKLQEIDSKILELAQDISSYGLKNTSKNFASIKK